jgi:hypothetical protein
VLTVATDQSNRRDAIQAAYDERYSNFMKALLISAELLPDLTEEELVEHNQIGEAIDAYHAEQRERHLMLVELFEAATTPEERCTYLNRLLAVIERNIERLPMITGQLNSLIRNHFTGGIRPLAFPSWSR